MKTHVFLFSRPAQVPTLVHKTHIFLLLAAACRVFPTNNIFSVLSPRICFCSVNPYFLAGIAAFFEISCLAVAKHDLKPSGTFFRKFACDLGLAGIVVLGFLPPEGD